MATIDLSALSSLDRDRAASTLPAGHRVRISRRPPAYADSQALQEVAIKALAWRRRNLWRIEQIAPSEPLTPSVSAPCTPVPTP